MAVMEEKKGIMRQDFSWAVQICPRFLRLDANWPRYLTKKWECLFLKVTKYFHWEVLFSLMGQLVFNQFKWSYSKTEYVHQKSGKIINKKDASYIFALNFFCASENYLKVEREKSDFSMYFVDIVISPPWKGWSNLWTAPNIGTM